MNKIKIRIKKHNFDAINFFSLSYSTLSSRRSFQPVSRPTAWNKCDFKDIKFEIKTDGIIHIKTIQNGRVKNYSVTNKNEKNPSTDRTIN
jgi:hypothetical protein